MGGSHRSLLYDRRLPPHLLCDDQDQRRSHAVGERIDRQKTAEDEERDT